MSCTKGILNETLETTHQILKRVLPGSFHSRLAYLSGPSFAAEVAQGQPTAVTVAADDPAVALQVGCSVLACPPSTSWGASYLTQAALPADWAQLGSQGGARPADINCHQSRRPGSCLAGPCCSAHGSCACRCRTAPIPGSTDLLARIALDLPFSCGTCAALSSCHSLKFSAALLPGPSQRHMTWAQGHGVMMQGSTFAMSFSMSVDGRSEITRLMRHHQANAAVQVQRLLSSSTFRCYRSRDVAGEPRLLPSCGALLVQRPAVRVRQVRLPLACCILCLACADTPSPKDHPPPVKSAQSSKHLCTS